MKIQIEMDTDKTFGTEVFIDGIQVTGRCRSLLLQHTVNSLPVVAIDLLSHGENSDGKIHIDHIRI